MAPATALRSPLLPVLALVFGAPLACSGSVSSDDDRGKTPVDGGPRLEHQADTDGAPGLEGGGSPEQGTSPDQGVSYSGSFTKGQGYLSASLTVSGTARSVELYVPSTLKSSPALLVTFHGTNGDAKDMISSSTAQDLADAQGLLVVSPQARTMTKGDWDNHSSGDVYWETYPSTTPSTNPDLRLVMAIVEESIKTFGVDRKRVYTLGHSNGGFFSILVATALPGWVAAFAANSSGLVKCASTDSCSFSGSGTSCASLSAQSGWCSCSGAEKPGPVAKTGRKVPAYLSHGDDDTTVSVYYTCSLASEMQSYGYATKVHIEQGLGHGMPYGLASSAWAFMSAYKLP
jgi:poly(3-hydroxybutyrate) depolymerase